MGWFLFDPFLKILYKQRGDKNDILFYTKDTSVAIEMTENPLDYDKLLRF